MLGTDRWLVGVEGEADPVTGRRRRHTVTVRGDREQAEVVLARLKLRVDSGEVVASTGARTVAAACELYLADARTELQTVRTDRSACRRIVMTVLPGGATFGDRPLSKVDWRIVEQVFAKWQRHLQPPTQARYASTLSKVFEHAKRAGWMRSNPAKDARSPKVPTHRPIVPVAAEVREALRSAQAQDFLLYAFVM